MSNTRDEINGILSYLSEIQRTSRAKVLQPDDLSTSDKASIRERNKQYTRYIAEYTNHYSQKARLSYRQKKTFFGFSLVMAGAIITAGVVAIVALAFRENFTVESLIGIVTAFAGVITAALALPSIIAGHLFPQSEDDKSAEVFGKMVDGDMQLRKMYINENDYKELSDKSAANEDQ